MPIAEVTTVENGGGFITINDMIWIRPFQANHAEARDCMESPKRNREAAR
jgi:hypothetical protein